MNFGGTISNTFLQTAGSFTVNGGATITGGATINGGVVDLFGNRLNTGPVTGRQQRYPEQQRRGRKFQWNSQ